MRLRLTIICLVICCAVFGLVGIAVSENETTEYEGYVVQQGQTLTVIAQEYGIPVELVASFNKMSLNTPLTPGQVIMVPIISELMPQTAGTVQGTVTDISTGDQVVGTIGKVAVERVEIKSAPNGGQVLFRNATKGTDLLIIGEAHAHYAVLMSDGSTGWVPIKALTMTQERMAVDRPAPRPETAVGRPQLVDTAFEYLGTPYRYGGRLPANVDCSLLIQTVFARHGIKLPRTAASQFQVGTPVAVADLQPGDRLYFTSRAGGGSISHTGLYIGNGRFIHASSNRGAVAVDELRTPNYWSKFAGARR